MNARLSSVLAQANSLSPVEDESGGWVTTIELVLAIAVGLVLVVGNWKMYEKAGKPGWGCVIPIYMWVVLLEIAGKPIWWIALFIIPPVFIVIWFLIHLAVAHNFGKSTGFGIAMAFCPFVFYAILGFGEARYQGVTTHSDGLL